MLQKVEALEKRLLASPVHKNPQLEILYNLCQKKAEVLMVSTIDTSYQLHHFSDPELFADSILRTEWLRNVLLFQQTLS